MPSLHLSIPVVCKTQGSLCSTWSLVGTETHSGARERGVEAHSCVKGQHKLSLLGHGKMRKGAPQGEDHSLKPGGPCGVTGSKILKGSASECVNSHGLMPKLWCGCGLWERRAPQLPLLPVATPALAMIKNHIPPQ